MIALHVQWSGSTLTVWDSPVLQRVNGYALFAPVCSILMILTNIFNVLLMAIFAREYHQDNFYERFSIY